MRNMRAGGRFAGRAGSAFTLAVMAAAIGALAKTCLLIDDTQPKPAQPTLTKYDLERIEAAKQKRSRRAARKSPNSGMSDGQSLDSNMKRPL